jgi:putative ABC transport system permease protein
MRLLPIDYAVRNLGRSRLRLVLSVLGSALVVLLVLGAGAFVAGMTESLTHAGDERNVLIMGIGSEESFERSEIPASTASLLAASVPGLQTRHGVTFVSPEVDVQLPVSVADAPGQDGPVAEGTARGRPVAPLVLIRGVTPAAMLVHSQVQLIDGRLAESGHDEVVVGALAHLKLGVPASTLAVGRKLTIEGREWTIAGRLAAPHSVIEAEVWMPLTDLKQLTKRETDSCVVATLGSGPDAAELADIQAFCRQRLDLEITAMSEAEYYGKLAAFFAPIRAVTWVTAGLIALGGLLGGLNTMYAAFASRVRELGMLQCLGFRRAAIVVSLVQESCVACAAGAVLASAAALWLLDGVSVQFSMGAFGLKVGPPVLVIGLLAGLGLGLIGALPPAVRCLRLPIPESLKAI